MSRQKALDGSIAQHKFDLDNLETFVLDCFNGLFYKDDRQIIKLNSTKYYDLVPRTEITINYLPMRSLNKILEKISPYEFYDLYILCQKIVVLYDEHRMKESLQHLTPEQQEIASELLAEMTKFLPALKKIEKEMKNA